MAATPETPNDGFPKDSHKGGNAVQKALRNAFSLINSRNNDTKKGLPFTRKEQEAMSSLVTIDNALKYSRQGDQASQVLTSVNGSTYRILPKDKGTGIPAVDLDSVFEPFFRVSPSQTLTTDGFGLRLSLCLSITEAHGDSIGIWIETAKGRRATLTFPIDCPRHMNDFSEGKA